MAIFGNGKKISNGEVETFINGYFYFLKPSAAYGEDCVPVDYTFLTNAQGIEPGTLVIGRHSWGDILSGNNWQGRISIDLSTNVPPVLKPASWEQAHYVILISQELLDAGRYQGIRATASRRVTHLYLVRRPDGELLKAYALVGSAPPQSVFGGSQVYYGEFADDKVTRRKFARLFRLVCRKG